MGHDRRNAENLRLRNFRRENPPQAQKKGLLQMAELVYRPVIGAARTMFKALDLKIDTQGSEHIPKAAVPYWSATTSAISTSSSPG